MAIRRLFQMRTQTLGDKRDFAASRIRNDEASATILRGQPVILSVDGTEDGLAVVLPSSGSAGRLLSFYYGVALDDVAAGQLGEVQRDGLCNYAILVRQTRSSSTVSWATEDTMATGILLEANTVNNYFSSGVTTIASAATFGMKQYYAWLAQSLASYAGSASATSDTRTALTTAVKAFLRGL